MWLEEPQAYHENFIKILMRNLNEIIPGFSREHFMKLFRDFQEFQIIWASSDNKFHADYPNYSYYSDFPIYSNFLSWMNLLRSQLDYPDISLRSLNNLRRILWESYLDLNENSTSKFYYGLLSKWPCIIYLSISHINPWHEKCFP